MTAAVGVILYGPPASGKDTITTALSRLDARYILVEKLKAGGGRATGYRLVPEQEIDRLARAGDIVYEHRRYGSRYALAGESIAALLERDAIPVVHMGQLAGIHALASYPADWVTVLLWCSEQTTRLRAQDRCTNDLGARLVAWKETAAELTREHTAWFSLRVDTERLAPDDAAQEINRHVTWRAGRPWRSDPPTRRP